MAKIVVYTMAYRGDVFPFVPIASELSQRGHDVVFVGPAELRDAFAAEPFSFRDGDCGDLTPSRLDAYGDYVRRWGRVLSGAMLLRLYLGQLVVPRLAALHAAIDEALEGADLLVSHPAASLVGRMACEVRGIPWIVGDLFPMLTPTDAWGPAVPRAFHSRGPISRAVVRQAWQFGRSPLGRWFSCERGFAEFRASLGLETAKGDTIFGRLSPFRNFVLVSPRYFPPASDWHDDYQMTGFVHWTGSAPVLPPEVETFLADGDPPVVVTLGTSAAGADPSVFGRVRAALDRVGARGLFLTSMAEHSAGLPADATWPYVPLQPLLPRARAIVHSGAHGTNSLALAAGVPSVVIPQLFDQVWHGRRQEQLGTGALVGRDRDEVAIERALHRALDDGHASAARGFADALSVEDGVGRACDVIDGFLRVL